ncbi:MAG TPA: hypothetical protein QGI71_02110 [Dehalococcoidia bacterium]|nr:hypothetical protein [Dehalococcoidia bacterium]
MALEQRRMHGEVSEREDLLDGRVRVDLDGDAEGWDVTASFGWRRGPGGEVALEEGELTLTAGTAELYASLDGDGGAVEPDAETGAADVRANFVVEGTAGEWPALVDRLVCTLAIGTEEWSGELRLGE